MTRDELLAKLQALKDDEEYDMEGRHVYADMLLLEYINDLEITTSIDAINKWYA